MKTKHLTIMFTDIKGFTSKTAKSSRAELHKLLDLHDQLVIPIFNEFGGKVVKTIGDSFMVAFHSPTDAVLCGMKIQNVLAKHNEKIPEDERLEVRVAINSGEVTIKGNDVFGEAVNIASRLEGIAEPGDIYFTEAVYLSMNKNEIPTAEVGHRHFKGIPEEIKVYKVLRERKKKKSIFGKKEMPVTREYAPKKKRLPKMIKWAAVVFIFLLLIILFVEVNKQKEEKEFFQRELKNVIKGDVREELEATYYDTIDAIEAGDKRRAKKGINALIEANKKLHNPELKDAIRELEAKFDERFR